MAVTTRGRRTCSRMRSSVRLPGYGYGQAELVQQHGHHAAAGMLDGAQGGGGDARCCQAGDQAAEDENGALVLTRSGPPAPREEAIWRLAPLANVRFRLLLEDLGVNDLGQCLQAVDEARTRPADQIVVDRVDRVLLGSGQARPAGPLLGRFHRGAEEGIAQDHDLRDRSSAAPPG